MALVSAAVWIGCQQSPPPATTPAPPAAVSTYSPAELCREYKGKPGGATVLVYFNTVLPVPTADPLVWEYRPGVPAENFSPTVRMHFDSLPGTPPAEVTGRVAGWEADFLPRRSRAGGVLVLRGCHAGSVPP